MMYAENARRPRRPSWTHQERLLRRLMKQGMPANDNWIGRARPANDNWIGVVRRPPSRQLELRFMHLSDAIERLRRLMTRDGAAFLKPSNHKRLAALRAASRRVKKAMDDSTKNPRSKRRNPGNGGSSMAALNPWMYRTRRGRFTRRRKGARRTWVPSPGRARRKRRVARGRYSKMPVGLRRWLMARLRGKPAAARKRRSGKRRTYYARRPTTKRRRPRTMWQRGIHGPQPPRGKHKQKAWRESNAAYAAAARRRYYVAKARASRRRPGGRSGRMAAFTVRGGSTGRPANDNSRFYDQFGRRMTSNPRRRRMRRYATTVNPRRRRGVRGFRRVRRHLYTKNPGMGSIVQMAKSAVMPAAAGFAGGAIAGYIDAKLLPKKRLLQGLAKFALGLGGAFLLRKSAAAAGAFVGSTIGTIGYGFGLRAGGGMVADTRGQALAGIADMAAEDPELADLIANSENLGDLVTAGELADGEVEIADSDDDVADLVAE